MNLAVGDLDNGGNRGWCLDLAVGDLGHWCRCGGRCLDLAIGDLGHWCRYGGRSLNLTVRDLLDLAITDLRGSLGGNGSGKSQRDEDLLD